MRRPTIFISSTIYDFLDLRSALKYFLEQQGCTVLASEFNDFQKPLDKHSYNACLEAISTCDYFFLFVGARVGGWYDSRKRISITQKEYRIAYDLHNRSLLNIVAFIRSEVWQVREDRRALKRHLEKQDIRIREKNEILDFPSKFANDASFISEFIEEIGKNNETKKAIEEGSPLPSGNWIHVFKNFDEIVSAIKPLLFKGLPVEEASFRRALEGEVVEILKKCLIRMDDRIYSPLPIIQTVIKNHPIRFDSDSHSDVVMPTKQWDTFSAICIHAIGKKFDTVVLSEAITSSTFFQFDLSEASVKDTPVRRALMQLYTEIRNFNLANTMEAQQLVWQNSPARRPQNRNTVRLDSMKLCILYHLCHRWGNIIVLSESIANYLQHGNFREPEVFPLSPVSGMDAELNKETTTDDEIQIYLSALSRKG